MSNGTRPSHRRKASSPMAPAFMVSAPGKVIVFGEHAVAHGKTAMAAAISLRSYLHVTTLSKSQRTITLVFPDISLDHTWRIDDLPWEAFAQQGKKKKYHERVTSLDEDLVQAMRPHLVDVSPDVSLKQRQINHTAAASFLYLFLSLCSPSAHACTYTLRSTLPIGGGLGSSASISVCISAALLKQIDVLAGPHKDQPHDDVERSLRRVNEWAFVGELCIHNTPSGVDNTVSTHGKAVMFSRPNYNDDPKTEFMPDFPALPLRLINTKQPRSTSAQLAKVAARKEKYPGATEHILDGIDEVTRAASDLITSEDFDPTSDAKLEELGEFFKMNHGFLVSLGVSHPKLDRIRQLVESADVGWTKLTGAGGGGCAITLLRNQVDAEVVERLEADFLEAGFEQYSVTLGGDGVGILYPAVLHNGTDEEGGEEIDQQKFLRAEGPDEIERLVGVGLREKREEWKFWR